MINFKKLITLLFATTTLLVAQIPEKYLAMSGLSPADQTTYKSLLELSNQENTDTQIENSIPSKNTLNNTTSLQHPDLSDIEQFYNESISTFSNNTINNYVPTVSTETNQLEQTILKNKIEALGYTYSETTTLKPKKVFQFGYDMFNDYNFAKTNYISSIGPDYIIGPGDEISIHIFGKIEENFTARVEASGHVYLPKVGPLLIAGLTYKNAQESIRKSYLSEFVNISISVSLIELRTIKVYLLGNVAQPGSYTLPADTSLFKALYTSGGPKKTGSLRQIKLIRKNEKNQNLDLYNYLLKPDINSEIILNNFDIIFVPSIGSTAKITGEVKRPAIYEITSSTSLYDLVSYYGGGLLPSAYTKLVQIERLSDTQEKKVIDLTFKSESDFLEKAKSFMVHDGDSVRISKRNTVLQNSISINGYVGLPGTYQIEKNMTLFDALEKANGLLPEADTSKIGLYTFRPNSLYELNFYSLEESKTIPIHKWDVITVRSFLEKSIQQQVSISGEIKKPGNYILLHHMRVSDLIELAGLTPESVLEEGELFRHHVNGYETLITFNIKEVLEDVNSPQNTYLSQNDHIMIKRHKNYAETNRILISGEVKYPGYYLASKTDRLSDIIKRAGGFTDDAFLAGATFTRAEAKRHEQHGERRILSEEQKRIIYDQSRLSALTKDNQDLYNQALFFLESKIEDSKGRVIINISDLATFEASPDNVLVQNEDTLFIPPVPNSVLIVGGVQNPTSILFTPQKNTSFYISRAGGFSEFAKKKTIYVFKANGTIEINPSSVSLGDTIYVPEKIKTNKLEIIGKITQITFQTISAFASLNYLFR